MILKLVRKDFLLVKKYVYIMILVTLIAPTILYMQMEVQKNEKAFYGTLIFFLIMFVIVLLLSNSVSIVEETYKKGCAYLCTTPYSRNQIVISKYVFSYCIFVAYVVIYIIEHLFLPQFTIMPSKEIILLCFAFVTVFRGVLIPLEFKFGYEKAKYIIFILVMGTPFISSLIIDKLGLSKLDFSFINNISINWMLVIVIATLVFAALSVCISCRIFNKKDLM